MFFSARRDVVPAFVALIAAMTALGTGCTPPRIPLSNPWVRARSPDERRIAWAQRTPDGKASVAIDGSVRSGEYDEIGAIVFSPDGRRIAYWANDGGRWRMVVDGDPGPEFDGINMDGIAFSPDGKRLAYSARRENLWYAVADHKAIGDKGYLAVHDLAWSPDGRRFAFAAVKGEREAFVIDGIAGPALDAVSAFLWSPDSGRYAYVASDDGRQCIVLDGREGKKYVRVNAPAFSRDGRHFAYGAIKNGKSLAVVDGEEGPEFEMNRPIDPLKFAPSGGRVGYAARKGDRGKWVFVIGGREGPEYDAVAPSSLAFNPGGKGFAYAAAGRNGWTVVDEKGEGPAFDKIAGPVYSPDGRHLAYGAIKGNRLSLVVDGRRISEFEKGDISDFSFSGDGSHVAFKVIGESSQSVVLDGRVGPAYTRTYKPAFTAGGIEFLAERESDGWLWRVLMPYPDGNDPSGNVKTLETKLSVLPEKEPDGKCGPCENQKLLLQENLKEK